MPIVLSSYEVGAAQVDGRRFVSEQHTDHLGAVHRREYGPVGVVDYAAIMSAYAARLEESLAEREFMDGIAVNAAPTMNWQTGTQFLARFRAAYREASGYECARLAWWIIRRLLAGDVTDAQLRSAFGLTTQQYNALKSRLQALHDNHVAVTGAAGE